MLAAPVTENRMTAPAFALTAIAATANPAVYATLDDWLAARNLVPIRTRDVPVPRSLSDRRLCRTMWISAAAVPASIAAELRQLSEDSGIDLIWQEMASRQRDYRLAIFDMDSTLIRCEVIDELATEAGVGEAVSTITEQAMRGEIDFQESFRRRLSMLRGLPEEVLMSIAGRLPVTEGMPELITTLRARGIYTAIVSGGFTYFAEYLQRHYGFDRVLANALEIIDHRVTGRVLGDIIDGPAKRDWLMALASELAIEPEQIIAVGDGANDIPMLQAAGLGVAFQAKPRVREVVPCAINFSGLDSVLYLLGSKSELHVD
jgi:phosphoserine phosphatase